jgi:alpha-glucosidase
MNRIRFIAILLLDGISCINATDKDLHVELDLSRYSDMLNFTLISEGEDPLLDFSLRSLQSKSDWSHTIAPRGGLHNSI